MILIINKILMSFNPVVSKPNKIPATSNNSLQFFFLQFPLYHKVRTKANKIGK